MILDLLASLLAKLPWIGPRFRTWWLDEGWDDETKGDAENPSIPDGPSDYHVTPIGDMVEHEAAASCVCGPTVEPVERDDGSFAWLLVHHSLDGREQHEHPAS